VSQPAPKRYQAHPLYITARKGESLWGIVNKIAIRGCMTGRDASGKAQWDRDCIKSKLVTKITLSHLRTNIEIRRIHIWSLR
jgi:hypothetical protein